jgi:hypothetical protein
MGSALIKMAASLLFVLCSAGQATASHFSILGSIDAIDHTFISGGGIFGGNLSSGSDDDWLVFAANLGDILTISVEIDGNANFVLLQDTGDGSFAVGDAVNVTNFNINQVGNGSPIEILSCVAPTWETFCETGATEALTWAALYTGQYGIGISVTNDDNAFAGDWAVNLAGNTLAVEAVPVPAAVWLFGSALIGLIGFSKRKAVGLKSA